jgi:lauroyl/myristoyl acyltransferase
MNLPGALLFFLADILIEGIWAFSISRKQVINRYRIINPEVIKPYSETGQSIIGVTGHYANWEWGSLSASLQTEFNTEMYAGKLESIVLKKPENWLWSHKRFKLAR